MRAQSGVERPIRDGQPVELRAGKKGIERPVGNSCAVVGSVEAFDDRNADAVDSDDASLRCLEAARLGKLQAENFALGDVSAVIDARKFSER